MVSKASIQVWPARGWGWGVGRLVSSVCPSGRHVREEWYYKGISYKNLIMMTSSDDGGKRVVWVWRMEWKVAGSNLALDLDFSSYFLS